MLLVQWLNFIQLRVFARWLINSPLTATRLREFITGTSTLAVRLLLFFARPMKFLVRHFSAPPSVLYAPAGTKPSGLGFHRAVTMKITVLVWNFASRLTSSRDHYRRSTRKVRFVHSFAPRAAEFAEKRLSSETPPSLDRVFFFSSHFINSQCVT